MDDDKTVLDQPHAREIVPGTLLLGTYRVERQLNAGGMALTFLAHHSELHNSKHVVKVIKSRLVDNLADALNVDAEEAGRKTIALFKREAEVLMKIRHEAIVGYHGFQKDDKYGFCLVMEYVEGPTLKEYLKRNRLTVAEFWQLRNQLAAGLAAAHAKGIFHRDISPDNIILPGGNIAQAKLIDFGIAKLYEPLDRGTIIGSLFVGKYDYAAPEQFNGQEIGAYSDIYSLGLVLAEAVTGKKINQGFIEGKTQSNRTNKLDLASLPQDLRAQFSAMFQVDPAQRLQSLGELLQRWPEPSRIPFRKTRLIGLRSVTLIGMSVLVLGLAAAVFLTQLPGHEELRLAIHRYGYITLNSSPEGALVLGENSRFVGVTPVKKALLPATINALTIQKSGYRDETITVNIEQAKELADRVTLSSLAVMQ